MRNLKRVLSLTLASVMLLGMMVVGSSAADYADVTSEHNTEAIEVLQAANIMVGDNGNFNPDKNVTRNEMAVVMSNLMNYRVATYTGTSPFTDVPAWAEPYVAACYANGITSGMNATTYGGEKTVTAGQAALMLMKALGYFQYPSDFKTDWLLETTRQGTYIGLFDDVEAGVREAMTRNDVAQLVLNTLEATMVEVDDNALNVTTPDGTVVNAGNNKYFYRVDHTSNPDYLAIYGSEKTASAINGIQGPTIELGEKLYGGDLKRVDTRDDFGRPAIRWTFKLDEVGYYPEKPLATYTAKVSVGELYELVGKQVLDDISNNHGSRVGYRFSVYADGKPIVTRVYGTDFDSAKPTYFADNRNNSGAAGDNDAVNQAGKGVVTEVYRDGDGNLDIVYINTYVMQATDDYNSNKDTLNVDVLTDPSNIVGDDAKITVTQLNGDDFDLANYKEDDYILYTVANGKVKEIFPAEVIKGEVNAYSLASSVTIDGTKYDYGKRIDGVKSANAGRDEADDSASTEYRVGDVASIVVDKYGYVLYVDSAAISLGNYLYVNAAVKSSGIGSNYIAQAYFTDGTKSEVTLDTVSDKDGNKIDFKDPNGDKDQSDALPDNSDNHAAEGINGWYSYSVGSDGKYTLRGAKTNYTVSTVKIEGDKVAFAGSTAAIIGNADTILIVDDGDDVKVYTGVRNFPTVNKKDNSNFNVRYFMEKDDGDKDYVAVAFVDASVGFEVEDGSQDTILYVLDQNSTYVDTAKNETIRVYNVILNGEKTTIKVKDANALNTYTFYARWSVDGDGYYKATAGNQGGSNKGSYHNIALSNLSLSVTGSSLKIQDHTETYVITEDTEIVVVVVPNYSTKKPADFNGSTEAAASLARKELLDDRSADYEIKNVNGKRLNSLLGGYDGIYGKVDMFATENDGRVLDSLYVTVYGVYNP